jgi:hypothetical protein
MVNKVTTQGANVVLAAGVETDLLPWTLVDGTRSLLIHAVFEVDAGSAAPIDVFALESIHAPGGTVQRQTEVPAPPLAAGACLSISCTMPDPIAVRCRVLANLPGGIGRARIVVTYI